MSDIQLQQKINATGWIRDEFDERDKSNYIEVLTELPASTDLRAWCSPIEQQGNLHSCTAHAAIALVEYFQKRSFDKYFHASTLFLYKVTRNLLGFTGNANAYSRATMKALAIFGVPPEKYWSYDETKLDEEPPAFCYSYASRYRAIEYYRIDIEGRTRDVVLQQIKATLAANRPVMFGMLFYQSCLLQAQTTGKIPVPTDSDLMVGGHNMAAVGYDDNLKIKNTDETGIETTGAFLVRNSWGTDWGESGYGWLPYEYVLKLHSMDWWTMLKQDWLDTGEFEPKK